VVSLIKKRGLSVHDPANYRPITDQHTFSEILEKLFFFDSSRTLWNLVTTVNFNPHIEMVAQPRQLWSRW